MQEHSGTTTIDYSGPVPAAVIIRNLTFRYPDGHEALKDLSLEIQTGQRVALVGPNGAGKSTLLMHLNGSILSADCIEVGGVPVEAATLPRVRAIVGLVFQNPDDQLFSPTVFDDVAYGPLYMGLPKDEIHARVQRALEAVDMAGFEDRMPHRLSIGQKKRVSVATVLSMETSILALDEPTAGLDPRARRNLIALLKSLPHTLIASTHDMRFVQDLFDRVIVMDQGRIVADGNTSEVLADTEFLEAHGLEAP